MGVSREQSAERPMTPRSRSQSRGTGAAIFSSSLKSMSASIETTDDDDSDAGANRLNLDTSRCTRDKKPPFTAPGGLKRHSHSWRHAARLPLPCGPRPHLTSSLALRIGSLSSTTKASIILGLTSFGAPSSPTSPLAYGSVVSLMPRNSNGQPSFLTSFEQRYLYSYGGRTTK